jgi:hypothetical protein
MGSGEWGMGGRDSGIGNGNNISFPFPTPHSHFPFPIPYSPLPTPHSRFPTPYLFVRLAALIARRIARKSRFCSSSVRAVITT